MVLTILVSTALVMVPVTASLDTSSDTISYVTYFGGSNIEEVSTTACRDDGVIAMIGHSNSPDLPVSQDAFQQEFCGGEWDAFVTMYDRMGDMILCTYLGGSEREHVDWVAFDNSGNIVVVGNTASDDFPITDDALQSERVGEFDGFIAVISENGTLLYGTYFGGNSTDSIEFVAIDNNGNYLFGGTTSSAGLATEGAFQTYPQGGLDAYVAKLSSNGSTMLLFSYYGGSTTDRVDSMTVDSSCNFILSGQTKSEDFPTSLNAFQEDYAGAGDVFLTKIASDGSEIQWSTFIGGSSEENGRGVGVDSADSIIVTGAVTSSDLESYNAFQPEYGGECDTLIAKFTSQGEVQSLSYLGGNQLDYAYDVEADESDRIVIAGRTLSDNYPLYEQIQSNRTGHLDLTITIMSNDMDSLVMSTLFGGSKEDSGESVSISSDGRIVITGRTASDDLPCTENAEQDKIGGSYDSFMVIISTEDSANIDLSQTVILTAVGVAVVIIAITIWKRNHLTLRRIE
ncbi:MAG: hypothetical protein ACFFEV_08530 [Candidatus Thorarchaeota archaeon]